MPARHKRRAAGPSLRRGALAVALGSTLGGAADPQIYSSMAAPRQVHALSRGLERGALFPQAGTKAELNIPQWWEQPNYEELGRGEPPLGLPLPPSYSSRARHEASPIAAFALAAAAAGAGAAATGSAGLRKTKEGVGRAAEFLRQQLDRLRHTEQSIGQLVQERAPPVAVERAESQRAQDLRRVQQAKTVYKNALGQEERAKELLRLAIRRRQATLQAREHVRAAEQPATRPATRVQAMAAAIDEKQRGRRPSYPERNRWTLTGGKQQHGMIGGRHLQDPVQWKATPISSPSSSSGSSLQSFYIGDLPDEHYYIGSDSDSD